MSETKDISFSGLINDLIKKGFEIRFSDDCFTNNLLIIIKRKDKYQQAIITQEFLDKTVLGTDTIMKNVLFRMVEAFERKGY